MRYRALQNKITPAIPFLFIYDKDGDIELDDVFLTWDTTKMKTSHFHYKSDTNKIILNTNASGLYKITFNCSMDDGAAIVDFSVYKNGVAEEGSVVETYVGDAGQNTMKNSVSLVYIIYLEKGDYIQIHGDSTGATNAHTMPETSRLVVEFLPMKGWDNNSGGRLEYKGGITR